MKRLLLFPILMFGFSFACNQPYEEVGGIKIGCPQDVSFKLSSEDGDSDRLKSYKKELTDSFFNTVTIKVLDGNIEQVSFNKLYHEISNQDADWDSMVTTLSEKWGEYGRIDLPQAKIYSIKNPNSNLLEMVSIMQVRDGSTGINGVTYFSQKIHDHLESVRNDEEAARTKQLEGF